MAKLSKEIKVVSINLGNVGSTGKIAESIKKIGDRYGIEVYTAYPPSDANNPIKKKDIIIGNKIGRYRSYQFAYYTGLNGCFSVFSTLNFLRKIEKIKPNIIHLHNLHHTYINLPMLFSYIKKKQISTIWTLHDCWAFTGQCPYFTISSCDKWKSGCFNCPNYREYPESRVDTTKLMWKLKKKWFNGVNNMIIVTPSVWLADLVKNSFLKNYPVQVINNGIDVGVFRRIKSDFRIKYGISENKCIILGVAYNWDKRKGLDVFLALNERLNKEKYQIVLVGTDKLTDKLLPSDIISIHRTKNQEELAKIYSSSNIFVNPTREDNFPTVNIEALSCGVPVITFNTGGSPESITNKCGRVVDVDDINELTNEIKTIFESKIFSIKDCIEQSKKFSDQEKFKEYIDLYKSIIMK